MREGESVQRGVVCCELPSDHPRACTASRDETAPSSPVGARGEDCVCFVAQVLSPASHWVVT